jgi:hypothetical protein
MSLLKESTRGSFGLAVCWLGFMGIAGCADSMVILKSVPTRILGVADNDIQKSDEYWLDLRGGKVHVYAFNSVTLESQARFVGIPVKGSGLGYHTLGSSPFVIELIFDLDIGSKLAVNRPMLTMNEQNFDGSALRPASKRSCVDQADGTFLKIPDGQMFGHNTNGAQDIFCIRYEFPIDPVHPENVFSVDFGVLEINGDSYPLHIEFEGVKRVIRTSL